VKSSGPSGRSPTPLLTLESQIKRDLRRHLKALGFHKDDAGLLRPPEFSKTCFRMLHYAQRNERLLRESPFIQSNWLKLRKYFADGAQIRPTSIKPALELVAADTWQSDLFRFASLTWSVPVSQGYGRRLRFLVWDNSNRKLIGIVALGDPVFNLRVRDAWIGWTLKQREKRLVNILDAYVLGAVPPYNMLLGAKLIASMLRTSDVVELFAKRYGGATGIISRKRKNPQLCLLTSTSALGRSSIYNRMRLDGQNIFEPIGYTSGWGHFHIPDGLFQKMRHYLKTINDSYSNNHRFGDGPNWKLRAVRKTLSRIGLDPDLMRHNIGRQVFVCQLATNGKAFLTGHEKTPDFTGLVNVKTMATEALARWVIPRANRRSEFREWNCSQILQGLLPIGKANMKDVFLKDARSGTLETT
jgi:hypothetical protein